MSIKQLSLLASIPLSGVIGAAINPIGTPVAIILRGAAASFLGIMTGSYLNKKASPSRDRISGMVAIFATTIFSAMIFHPVATTLRATVSFALCTTGLFGCALSIFNPMNHQQTLKNQPWQLRIGKP